MNKTKLELGAKDLAILVKPNGDTQIYIPFENEEYTKLTKEQLVNMLKEIRILELAFTEIVNEVKNA